MKNRYLIAAMSAFVSFSQIPLCAMAPAGEAAAKVVQKASPEVVAAAKEFLILQAKRAAKVTGIGAAGATVGYGLRKPRPVAPVVPVVRVKPKQTWQSVLKAVWAPIGKLLPSEQAIKNKIIEKGPEVGAKTAALVGAGAVGYGAAYVSAQGTLGKCVVGAVGIAAGTGLSAVLDTRHLVALGLASALGWTAHNRVEINDLIKKWGADEDALAQPGVTTKFYRWQLHQWPNAKSLYDHESQVIAQLKTDVASANGSFNINHLSEQYPVTQALNGQVTWADVLRAIEQELKDVKKDRDTLEAKYLTSFNFWPRLYQAPGIQSRYNELCKEAQVKQVDPDTYQDARYWEPAQLNNLGQQLPDALYKSNSLFGQAFQGVFKPNFGRAAQLWWHLKCMQSRLEQLQQCVKKLGANTVTAALPTFCLTCRNWGSHAPTCPVAPRVTLVGGIPHR